MGYAGEIPASLGQLSDLEHLSLSRNHLEGEIPAEIGNLHKLKRLELHTNRWNIPSLLTSVLLTAPSG